LAGDRGLYSEESETTATEAGVKRVVLPKRAGVLVAVHAPLISGPFSDVGSAAGALLAIVGGGWIALSVLRQPTARVEAEAQPRVR
jgi:hypothetical protein